MMLPRGFDKANRERRERERTQEERKERIIEFARKLVQYPKGSDGYSPTDLINLKDAIKAYDKAELN